MQQRQTVFEARKFRVTRGERPGRDGRQHTYEIIEHPGAAVVLPLLDDGRVLLIYNHRVSIDQTLLELPAGTLDPGEDPQRCAARELSEETGYRAGKIEFLTSFYSTPGICTERMHVFVATELKPGAAELEPTEEVELNPMPFGQALAAIGEHRIIDAKSIVGLLYYDRCVRRSG